MRQALVGFSFYSLSQAPKEHKVALAKEAMEETVVTVVMGTALHLTVA